jgi:hypothetical protein
MYPRHCLYPATETVAMAAIGNILAAAGSHEMG